MWPFKKKIENKNEVKIISMPSIGAWISSYKDRIATVGFRIDNPIFEYSDGTKEAVSIDIKISLRDEFFLFTINAKLNSAVLFHFKEFQMDHFESIKIYAKCNEINLFSEFGKEYIELFLVG